MEKINFKDLPSTETPINAENLNQMQDNIENAVSAIVESGSNENGSWIKWADGTMICTSRTTKNVVNNTEWHNFYISDIASIPFAQPFKVLNSCQVNLFSQKNMWKLTSFIPNLRESGSFFIISPESFEGTVEIHVEAIGRWK